MFLKLTQNLLLLLISYIAYNIYDFIEITKDVDFKNNKNYRIIRGAEGFEDFHLYQNRYFIGGSNNNLKMFEMDFESIKEVKNGKIVVFDTHTQNLKLFAVDNFPKEIDFHPHGVYIFNNNLLYVINHAYNFGGERIEVIEINQNEGINLISYLT